MVVQILLQSKVSATKKNFKNLTSACNKAAIYKFKQPYKNYVRHTKHTIGVSFDYFFMDHKQKARTAGAGFF